MRNQRSNRLSNLLLAALTWTLLGAGAAPAFAGAYVRTVSQVNGKTFIIRINVDGDTALKDIKDFHICMGKNADLTVAEVEAAIEFKSKPEGWKTSVTKVGDAFYLNWYRADEGVELDDDNSDRFTTKIKDTDVLKKGDPEYVFTDDGTELIHPDHVVPNTGSAIPNGPVLVSAAGSCITPQGDCTVAVAESCAALDGTFELGEDCGGGACCLMDGTCMQDGGFDCYLSYGIHHGENSSCDQVDCPPVCPGDMNSDFVVDASDLAATLGSWGPCTDCMADVNNDHVVDAADLATTLGHWGPCGLEACGQNSGGDSCTPSESPGSAEETCCESVCLNDPFCCVVAWDQNCADQATFDNPSCPCGDEGTGATSDCCEANGTPGCDDPTCQNTVCTLDPFCCQVSWDSICANEAGSECETCQ